MAIGGRFTKEEMLRYSLKFAFGKVKFRDRKLRTFGLTDEDLNQLVADTIYELRRHGQWKELDDVIEPNYGPNPHPPLKAEDEPQGDGP